MKKLILFLPAVLAVCILFVSCQKEKTNMIEIKGGVRIVHNLKPKYDNPPFGLEFVQQIGELESTDEQYGFHRPVSVAEDEYGNIYILDDRDCCIKKFTSRGNYITQFGRRGQGPGEFIYPGPIDCKDSQILISSMSSLCHLFNLDGSYIKSFKLPRRFGFNLKLLEPNKIVVFSVSPDLKADRNGKLLTIFDDDGNSLQSFGEPLILEKTKGTWIANFLDIAVDSGKNIFASFSHQNRIEKYTESGDLLMRIDRSLPYEIEYKYEKAVMNIQGKAHEYDSEAFTVVSKGIGIDKQDRIWNLKIKKQPEKSLNIENFVIQDYLIFEVYSSEGILLTQVPVPENLKAFDSFKMAGDNIYFCDPFDQCCIFHYKIVNKKK